jgi:hypothetical protein
MVDNADALINLKEWINHKLKPTNPEPVGGTVSCGCAPVESEKPKTTTPKK